MWADELLALDQYDIDAIERAVFGLVAQRPDVDAGRAEIVFDQEGTNGQSA